jgi:hypothetical protein
MKLLSCVLLVSLTLLGCRSVNGPDPVAMVKYENVPVVTKSGKTLSLQEVRGVIAESATQDGWKVAEGKTGPVVASYAYKDKHFTTVQIHYTQQNFTIVYESSKNLKYRLSTQQDSYEPVQMGSAPRYPSGTPLIHGVYNKWVKELKDKIQAGFLAK